MNRSFAGLILTACFVAMASSAIAQSSLGIGSNELALKPTGPFAHIILWLNEQQREFYLAMTNALRAMREDPWAASMLVGLSFVYGIFHAAGPGHGKAVISSYMIANEIALRRGIILAFASSLLQAISAIVIVGVAWLALRGTGISMNQTARYMEIASFALILVFGLALLARKLPLLFRKTDENTLSSGLSASATTPKFSFTTIEQPLLAESTISEGARSAARPKAFGLNYQPVGSKADHAFIGNSDICDACGNAHIADPTALAGDFSWKTACSAIVAVGLRPCAGALIVLSFSLLNGLLLGGLLSTFAMAFGTFLTVAALATLAVTAKKLALRIAGGSGTSHRLKAGIEVAAALFITMTGALLLSAALRF